MTTAESIKLNVMVVGATCGKKRSPVLSKREPDRIHVGVVDENKIPEPVTSD